MSKLFLYLKTSTFRKNLLFASLTCLVIFSLIYFGLKFYTKHGDSQEVPTVKGLHITEAIRILEKAELQYQIDSVYQLDVKPGLVIEQDPEPSALVKNGRTIYLTIITQVAPEVEFPSILEKNLIEATAIIKNQSLKLGDTVYINDIAKDVVLEARFGGQPIQAGRKIAKGSAITLVLGNGRGSNEVEVPMLLNLTLNEARFSIQGLGLNLGSVSGNVTDSTTARVISQSPDSTSRFVPIGTQIHLILAN